MAKIIVTRFSSLFSLKAVGRFTDIKISLDGKESGSLYNPLELDVTPGKHIVRASHMGNSSKDYSFEISEGEIKNFEVQLNPMKSGILMSCIIAAFLIIRLLKHFNYITSANEWVTGLIIALPALLVGFVLFRKNSYVILESKS